MGLNAYWIFNHKKFSYPAAYSQSTNQRKSAGSFMAGFSYSQHSIYFDYTQLPTELKNNINSNLRFNKVKYSDYSLGFGYGYNWVFKKNWVANLSLLPGIGFKKAKIDDILYNDNHTLLFECKDIKINGALIETHDYSVIIDEYKNKLYEKTFKYQNGEKVMLSSPKPIGIGQLVENINNIRQGKYGDHNLPITGIIYPVLVLSDYKILPIGFPDIANDWYCQGLESHNLRENNKPLIIMSFITLIVYSNRFQEDGFDYYFEEYYKYIDSIDRTQPEHYISFDMFMERYAFDLKDFYTLLMSEFHQI
jgi:hypothetical protein